jgi:Ser/Thr protein kinase RdoA (MazF antagonist)
VTLEKSVALSHSAIRWISDFGWVEAALADRFEWRTVSPPLTIQPFPGDTDVDAPGNKGNESVRDLTSADLKFTRPELGQNDLADIARERFGLEGRFSALEGERDQNALITRSDGTRFVLKLSGTEEDPQTVDFQLRALAHIQSSDPEIPVPRSISGRDGQFVQKVEHGSDLHMARVLTWLPGIPLQDGPTPTAAGFYRIGRFIARLNLALAGFSHPASRNFMPWDICNGLIFTPQFRDLLPPPTRALLEPVLHRLKHSVYPQLRLLRSQVIHQDGHGGNLLRPDAASDAVSGVIDFGDMIHGPLICDVAVCASSFVETAWNDALEICSAICSGFDTLIPLQADEIGLLLDLIIARQVLTLQLFEFRHRHQNDAPDYVVDEQAQLIESLACLAAVDPAAFAQQLRAAMRDRR